MLKKEISFSELEVLQILWQNEKPMKVQEVCDKLAEDKWKYKTVATLLLRMEEKGAVKSEKKDKANYYTPLLDRKSYTELQTKSFIKRLYNGSAKDLAVSLLENADLTKDDIEEIRKMFDL